MARIARMRHSQEQVNRIPPTLLWAGTRYPCKRYGAFHVTPRAHIDPPKGDPRYRVNALDKAAKRRLSDRVTRSIVAGMITLCTRFHGVGTPSFRRAAATGESPTTVEAPTVCMPAVLSPAQSRPSLAGVWPNWPVAVPLQSSRFYRRHDANTSVGCACNGCRADVAASIRNCWPVIHGLAASGDRISHRSCRYRPAPTGIGPIFMHGGSIADMS